jgi:hypothetical protein
LGSREDTAHTTPSLHMPIVHIEHWLEIEMEMEMEMEMEIEI